ncbi:MAG: class I SAM-dependent methyltransferase [Oligoflexia bacterium]|nr:class I SAM-dependent methyltransferase [Oligoflexia bacterium]
MSQEFWEQNAETWTELIRAQAISSRAITGPAIVEQILRRNLRSVLDIGCGEGWLASQLLPRQIDYLGVDGSVGLIENAEREHPGYFQPASYEQITRGEWKSEKSFDGIVFNFSLLDEKIEDLLKAAAGFLNPARFLNPERVLLIQTLHPFFALPHYQDGEQIEDFKSMPLPFAGTMPWYGRTMGSWSKVFKNSGLLIEEIIEPRDPKKPEKPLSMIFALKKR